MTYIDMSISQSLHVELKICVWSSYKKQSFYRLVKHTESKSMSKLSQINFCVHKEYSVTRWIRGKTKLSENLY